MKKLLELIKKLLGMSGSSESSSSEKGFTLIELLIVIAVLGVLAAAVLITIDPIQQLARGRDAGRKQSLAQVGRSIEGYFIANGKYPASDGAFITTLKDSGDLKIDVFGYAAIPTSVCPDINEQNKICYLSDANSFVVFMIPESESEKSKGGCTANSEVAYYTYSSLAGRAGTVCGTPTSNTSTFDAT